MAKNEKTFNEQNMRKIIRILSGLSASQQQLAQQCVNEYQADKTYSKDNICFYNGTLYRAKTVTLGNTPSPESTYFEMLDGVEEEIDAQYIETLMSTVSAETWDYLKDFINNDIISTTHAWSSSRAYAEIQSAIQTAKDYTLEKVANSSTGSYIIANGTDEVIDDKHLYLISNASNNYDIYALVNGTPTKIGDTSVSLNGLLTETNAESTYLKQTDATATYATITTTDALAATVDGKANSADIAKMINHVGEYVATDSPRNASDEMYRLYHGKGRLAFQKFDSTNKVVYDFTIYDETRGIAPKILSNVDLNDVTYNAFLTVRSNCTNLPHTGSNFIGISMVFADVVKYGFQILCDANENQNGTNIRTLYIRHSYNGNWGDWTPIGTKKIVIGTPTVIEDHLATLTPDIDVVYAGTNTGELVNATGVSIFLVKYRKIGTLETQEAFNPATGKSIACRAKNWWDGTWSSWELTRSKVADTSGTATVSDGASGTVTYKIINGICYVGVNGLADGLNGLNGKQVCNITGLPATSVYTNAPIEYLGARVGTVCYVPNTSTCAVYKTSTSAGYGSFSYPVAES